EVYRWFVDRTGNPDQSYESARRVFRGGVVTGGAPFTKDVTYLYGLMQVANLVRSAFVAGRSDVLRSLFCGKVDVMDVPVLCELAQIGLLAKPRHLPPWVMDPRGIIATLTFSTFMQRIDLTAMAQQAQRILADTPVLRF
ncbi:MAG TPA: tyrosine/phenylalanine carboxypeptidase domain-containing protein, partial [Xanthomonadales bacterium]|nr:tyrosine/phenylalanine carboxypeptidase domain-containing protein [Xanthomonadales bacterium]